MLKGSHPEVTDNCPHALRLRLRKRSCSEQQEQDREIDCKLHPGIDREEGQERTRDRSPTRGHSTVRLAEGLEVLTEFVEVGHRQGQRRSGASPEARGGAGESKEGEGTRSGG